MLGDYHEGEIGSFTTSIPHVRLGGRVTMVMMLLWDYDKLGHLTDRSHGNDDVRTQNLTMQKYTNTLRNTQTSTEIHKQKYPHCHPALPTPRPCSMVALHRNITITCLL